MATSVAYSVGLGTLKNPPFACAALGPHEISLNCREHDFFVPDLLRQVDHAHMCPSALKGPAG